jgi:hypothetical protein
VYWTNTGTEPSATEMHEYLGNWLASPDGAYGHWYPVTGSFHIDHYFGGSIKGTYFYTHKDGSTDGVPAH